MAYLKFNKAELVNLSYSLRREILEANKSGDYCNTSIVCCNTRRYHGLLAVTLDRFGGDKFLLLSSMDESLIVNGKQFNLGIHCYGDIYEPRGHKYVVDFSADPVPQITYKVGEIVFRKSILICQDRDQVLLKYELLEAPSKVCLQLRPFLAYRNVHDLTHENSVADLHPETILPGGASFRPYKSFPEINLQLSSVKAAFNECPCWYNNITYIDEYRRGFDCREDLIVPGYLEMELGPGEYAVLSASTKPEKPGDLKKLYRKYEKTSREVTSLKDQLVRCADTLISCHNGRRKINAGFTWLYTGLLRETLQSIAGLSLYGMNSPEQFEEILDNLISDEQDRLFRRTTQVEAPLYLAVALQQYIDYGADPEKVWKKYGFTVKGILESYLPGHRSEVAMHPNGLLWAQLDGVALSWMNAYVHGRAVTERAGYQVETNAFWYNAVCFAIEMEEKYGDRKGNFVKEWTPVRDNIKYNYQRTFWDEEAGYLADYVGVDGKNMDVRPNQIYALWVKHSPLDEDLAPSILRVIDKELVTSRGIRTLSPRDIKYKGVYEGTQLDRDLAYHQGSTRPFLLEPYVEVCFKVRGPEFWKKAEWLCEGFYEDLSKHGVGAFSELYDGDPPHEPHGAISYAQSTAALLAVDHMLEINGEEVK